MSTEDPFEPLEPLLDPLLGPLLAEAPRLQRLARSLVAGRDVAADVVQETLLRACRRPAAEVRHVRGWLAAVATSVARRFVRAEARQARHVRALPPRDPEPSVADAVARTEALQRVAAALLALAEPYRTVLLLRFQNELGYAAIAARLHVPLETVRTRIKRGLQQLRRDLDERPGGRAAWAGPLVAWHSGRTVLGAGVAAAALLGAGLWLGFDAAFVPPDVAPVTTVGSTRDDDATPSPLAGTLAEPTAPRSASERNAAPPATPADTSASGTSRAAGQVDALWLTFRVVDAVTKAPIPGASVRADERFVRVVPSSGGGNDTDAERRSAVTDATGRCRVAWNGLASSSHVAVRAAGFGALLFWPFSDGDDERFGAQSVGELTCPDLELAPARALAGRVVTAGGQPAPGAELFLVVETRNLLLVESITTADGSGAFVVSMPSPVRNGDSHLVASFDGSLASVTLPPADTLVLRMLPTAELLVDVIDERSVPIAAATVVASPLLPWLTGAPRCIGGDALPRHRHATTDRTGRAVLGRLPVLGNGASCSLLAHAVDHRGEHREQALVAGPNHVRVVLPRGEQATVRGVVVDAATERPIAGALVRDRTRTAHDGAFGIADLDLRGGAVRLSVEAPGYATMHHEESVGGRGGDLFVRILLTPAADASPASATGARFSVPMTGGSIQLPETTPAAPRARAR